MHPRSSILLATTLLALMSAAPGCGTTPQEDCQSSNAVTCKRVFQCLTIQEAQAEGYGSSETECRARLEQEVCAVYFADGQPCDPGKTWRSDKARACARYIEGLPCSRIPDGLTGSGSPDCANICS